MSVFMWTTSQSIPVKNETNCLKHYKTSVNSSGVKVVIDIQNHHYILF